jgi:arginyl-tRNA synthetase
MHHTQAKKLAQLLKEALDHLWPDHRLSVEELYSHIGEAPQIEMGHFAFACFPLAKILKMGPPQISQKLALKISEKRYDWLDDVKSQGPYLNFDLHPGSLALELLPEILGHHFFQKPLTLTSPKTMIEYSQPNTHKVLHVGHMRNLCLGNALVRLGRYADQEIIAVTYPGDVGTHVAKTLWYMKYHCKEEAPNDETKGAWLGEIYTLASHKLEDEKGTSKEQDNRKQLTEILKQLEKAEGDFYELWKETRQWSLDLMNKAYKWADVSFERWFFESEVDTPSLELMKQYYKEGLLVEDQGAIGMDLSEDKLGFCLLIKSDGTGLYATKDVALAKKKFEDFGIEKNIYIVDNRQTRHFQQVFKVLEKIGFEQASQCYHLQYDVVELPDGAMSSRKGNIVPLMDLIDEMQATIKLRFLDKYEGKWSKEEIQQTSKEIANGAIKYGMIRVDNNRKIIFDKDEWLKLDGETGPYLQYVCARIQSMVEKQSTDCPPDFEKLVSKPEVKLLLKLSFFNHYVLNSYKNMKTATLCTYLYELGKLFNHFYTQCPIGKCEDEGLKSSRLELTKATGEVMKKGIELLGIPTPKRM